MIVQKEINVCEEDSLYFENLKDFKEWSDNIYDTYKDKNADICIEGGTYQLYGEVFDKVDVNICFLEEETIEEQKIREKIETRQSDIKYIELFIKEKYPNSNDIINKYGLINYLEMLNEGLLKYTLDDFNNFKKITKVK